MLLPGCFHVFFEHAFASPFWYGSFHPNPCGDHCSFCNGSYAGTFPCITHHGVVTVFFGLFVVGTSVIFDVRRIQTVIDSIKAMRSSARLIFGTNSEKPPAPILVKKLLLMLIAAGILECQHVSITANTKGGSDEYDLALGLTTTEPDGTILCLHVDSFWRRLPLLIVT